MKALSYHEEDIGRFIKSSKTKLVWTFEFNGETYNLALKVSKLSGNYEVDLNEKMLYKGNQPNPNGFTFPFKIQNAVLTVKQVGSMFDLMYDGRGFNSYKESSITRRTTNLEGTNGTRDAPTRERGRTDLSPQILPNRNEYNRFTHLENKSTARQTVPNIYIDELQKYKNGNGAPMSNAQIHQTTNPISNLSNEQQFFSLAPYMQFQNADNTKHNLYGNPGLNNSDDIRLDANYQPNFLRLTENNHLRINDRHEYERRGQHFLEINFPKGTENVNIIVDQVYNP